MKQHDRLRARAGNDQGTKVIAEIQSVNKRQTEIVVNLPSALASLESDLRAKMDRSSSWPDHRYDLRLRSRGAPSTGRRFRFGENLYLAQFKHSRKSSRCPAR